MLTLRNWGRAATPTSPRQSTGRRSRRAGAASGRGFLLDQLGRNAQGHEQGRELSPFGIVEPIVKLTALHFSYAGAGTLSLALRLHEARPGRATRLALGLVFLAPPVVALGFVLRSAVGQVGGACLMTAGVWSVALLQLPDARSGPHRWLWRISCLSPVIAMVLGAGLRATTGRPCPP